MKIIRRPRTNSNIFSVDENYFYEKKIQALEHQYGIKKTNSTNQLNPQNQLNPFEQFYLQHIENYDFINSNFSALTSFLGDFWLLHKKNQLVFGVVFHISPPLLYCVNVHAVRK